MLPRKLFRCTGADALIRVGKPLPHPDLHLSQPPAAQLSTEFLRTLRSAGEHKGTGMALDLSHRIVLPSMGAYHKHVLPGKTQPGAEIGERRNAGKRNRLTPRQKGPQTVCTAVKAAVPREEDRSGTIVLCHNGGDLLRPDEGERILFLPPWLQQPGRAHQQGTAPDGLQSLQRQGARIAHPNADEIDLIVHSKAPSSCPPERCHSPHLPPGGGAPPSAGHIPPPGPPRPSPGSPQSPLIP